MIENTEKGIRDIWDIMKWKTCIIGALERVAGGVETVFEKIMAKNFPQLTKASSHRFKEHYEHKVK